MPSPGEPLSQHFQMFSKPETLYTEVWWGVEKVPPSNHIVGSPSNQPLSLGYLRAF